MRLTVFGATGGFGQVLTQAALDQGHDVTALVRSPEKLGDLAQQVTVHVGDYFNRDARDRALQGSEAVLTTIGPPMKQGPNAGEYEAAMIELIAQLQAAQIPRILAVGGAGLRLGDEKLTLPRKIMRQVLRLIGGKGYLDKEREHNALFRSSLDWTILRPPQIAKASGQLIVSQDGPAGGKVDPEKLAGYMVECLRDDSTIRTAPFVATR